ncbi:unnamed protein product [Trichogramma brassicae]|uniref:Uncharacterized protein n=1 Tax=Trichogramma brassicae TaxID=86971 RepID=A0A6H5II86_9HYME|nr:unnamed protein product [Trichogramma brassicae]
MFFPTGISGDDDFAKLYLVQCKYDEVEVSFTVTFLVDDKPVKTEKSISRKFNQRVKELGIQKVYRVQNVNELLSAEDVMTIRCELTVRCFTHSGRRSVPRESNQTTRTGCFSIVARRKDRPIPMQREIIYIKDEGETKKKKNRVFKITFFIDSTYPIGHRLDHRQGQTTSLRQRSRCLEPDFLNPMENVTVTKGRDAAFTCVVNNLGGYRVSPSSASGDHSVANPRVTISTSVTRVTPKTNQNCQTNFETRRLTRRTFGMRCWDGNAIQPLTPKSISWLTRFTIYIFIFESWKRARDETLTRENNGARGLDQSRHQSHPGDTRARDLEQRPADRQAQRLQHVDAQHQERPARGPGHLHVPGQYRSHEESGELRYSTICHIINVDHYRSRFALTHASTYTTTADIRLCIVLYLCTERTFGSRHLAGYYLRGNFERHNGAGGRLGETYLQGARIPQAGNRLEARGRQRHYHPGEHRQQEQSVAGPGRNSKLPERRPERDGSLFVHSEQRSASVGEQANDAASSFDKSLETRKLRLAYVRPALHCTPQRYLENTAKHRTRQTRRGHAENVLLGMESWNLMKYKLFFTLYHNSTEHDDAKSDTLCTAGNWVTCVVRAISSTPHRTLIKPTSLRGEQMIEFLLKNGADPNIADVNGLTPLHIICSGGSDYYELARMLFDISDERQLKLQVNAQNNKGRTALHEASRFGHEQLTESLLRRGSNPNLIDENGSTVLHLLCDERANDNRDLVQMVLELSHDEYRPVDINILDKYGESPLRYALSHGHTRAAEKSADAELTETFFEICGEQLQVNSRNQKGQTALHLALQYGNKQAIESLLTRSADPNATDENGSTPLHVVCEYSEDDYDLMQMLFELSNDEYKPLQVNLQDNLGNTPLHTALYSDRKNFAQLLLRNGSNPNLGNKDGRTALHILALRNHDGLAEVFFKITDDQKQTLKIDVQDESGDTPLHSAVQNGHIVLTETLLNRDANPNVANHDGKTSLRIVCRRGNNKNAEQIFFKVMEAKHQILQVDAQDKQGNTPLHLLLEPRHLSKETKIKMIEGLLRRGADPNATNGLGETPLHTTCYNHVAALWAMTLFRVCDDIQQTVQLDARDKRGDTPMHLATQRKSKKMGQLLLERGVDPNSANAEGFTALHSCLNHWDDEFGKMLFEVCHKLNVSVQVDAQDKHGNTPLHLAVARNSKQMIELLLRNGARCTFSWSQSSSSFFAGDMIVTNDKYSMSEEVANTYSARMQLVIMNLQPRDFGGYKCISKNSLGDAESGIRLYEIALQEHKKEYDNGDNEYGGNSEDERELGNRLNHVYQGLRESGGATAQPKANGADATAAAAAARTTLLMTTLLLVFFFATTRIDSGA